MKTSIYDVSLPELTDWVKDKGEPKYRAAQVLEWIYKKHVTALSEMTNLPETFRENIATDYDFSLPAITTTAATEDGTEKLVLEVAPAREGAPHGSIECVILPTEKRTTLCISSQVGCSLDCKFCATATMGFVRNLTPGEIIGQVIVARKRITGADRKLSNIVFMGMGEPLLNYKSLNRALEFLTGHEYYAMAPSRITVSTSGVAPKLKELADTFPVNIAISLNGHTQDLRDLIMPKISKKYNLDELLAAAKYVNEKRSKPITFEYVLLADITDQPSQAEELVQLVKGIKCKFNLIPFNPFPGSPYGRPTPTAVVSFQKILMNGGVKAYIRWSQGVEIGAACGQLAIM